MAVEMSPSVLAEVVNRLPLAEAAHWLLRWACDDHRLTAIWEEHRGRGYEKIIRFPTLVQLVGEALLHYRGSGRRTFEKNIASDRLEASVAAAFGKLGRLPIAVSAAFLEHTATALNELVVPAGRNAWPSSLSSLRPITIDGKVIKRVAKRLKPLRGRSGGLIGGQSLVGLDGRSGLVLAMEADPDGDSSEQRLLPGLLKRLRRCCPGPRLSVADRGFGNLVHIEQFAADGGHYLIRLGKSLTFTADPQRPAQESRDSRGRKVVDSWGVLGGLWNRRRRAVRRIAVQDDAGRETLVLATDLDDATKYPAADLLTAYRSRQGIEGVFQQTTEVFGLQRLIGTTPQAGLFQFAFCLMLHNIVRLLVGYVAEANRKKLKEVSGEKFFDDLRDQVMAWRLLVTAEQTEEYFARLSERSEFQRFLRQLLKREWSATWKKSPPQPNRSEPHTGHARTHSSVHRILQQAQQTRPAKRPTPNTRRC